jgi:hypothetical protein
MGHGRHAAGRQVQRTSLITGPDAGRTVLTASLAKLLVVAELLTREEAAEPPGGARRHRPPAAGGDASDDAAMNALGVRHGGPDLVTAAAARVGSAYCSRSGRRG